MYQSPRARALHTLESTQDVRFVIDHTPSDDTSEVIALRHTLFKKRISDVLETLQRTDPASAYSLNTIATVSNEQCPWVLQQEVNGEKKTFVYDGPTYASMEMERTKEGILIHLVPIFYSHVIASVFDEYIEMRKSLGLRNLSAGIGVGCTIESSDNVLLLAQRGAGTVSYPNTLDTMGGNIDPNQSARAALIMELEEELGLKLGQDFQAESLRLIGIGEDIRYEEGPASRPDIMFHLKLPYDWEKLMQIFSKHAQKHAQMDCNAIVPFHLGAGAEERFEKMIHEKKMTHICEVFLAHGIKK